MTRCDRGNSKIEAVRRYVSWDTERTQVAHILSETLGLCNNYLNLNVLTHFLVKINNILVSFCRLII